MGKKLSEMTLQELWELFPIILTEHQPSWKVWYLQEEQLLRSVLSEAKAAIYHIGSTAIPEIWAKPIIDILVEVKDPNDFDQAAIQIKSCGYRVMNSGMDRISFNKGYTEQGFAERVFHLHLRKIGDHDELYFRDYLNDHSAAAREYEKLKLELWKSFEHDRDEYTRRKADIVRRFTECARRDYPNRYEGK